MLQESDEGRKDVEEKIFNLLKNSNGLKAKKIAALLSIDKTLVNSILYNELGNKCIKDDNYYWYAKCEVKKYANISRKVHVKEEDKTITREQNITNEDKIINLLFYSPGLKAYQIAERIGIQKDIVNSILYKKLRGTCVKLDNYYWYLSKDWNVKIKEKSNELLESKYVVEKVETDDEVIEKMGDITDPIEILKWLEKNGY